MIPRQSHRERRRDRPCEASATFPEPAGKVPNPAEPQAPEDVEPATRGPNRGIDRCTPPISSAKAVGAEYPLDARFACDRCFGPLEAAYDLEAIAAAVSRESVAEGPATLWR